MKETAEKSTTLAPDPDQSLRYYDGDFWRTENLKFTEPGCRMEKAARVITRLANGRSCSLLDVGCGPGALRTLLPANISYFGIDIAVQYPGPTMLEADIVQKPIAFGDKRFDIITALGVFEYMGDHEAEKFHEIAHLLRPGGHFLVSYTNFEHRSKDVYWALNNTRPRDDFRRSLEQYFTVDTLLPVGHNWHLRQPRQKLVRFANMHMNRSIPVVSRWLAVEYFFICSPRSN
jgi:cyclopropane fatty-acyl-phospholipid synthase-like methyltransferase